MGGKKESDVKLLTVRVDQGLLKGLESMRIQWGEQNKGFSCSREDLVRSILWKAIDDRVNEQEASI